MTPVDCFVFLGMLKNMYQLSMVKQSTSDVNECLSNNGGCAQICTNTVGSFTCSCNTGYSLGADTRSCVGKRSQLMKSTNA